MTDNISKSITGALKRPLFDTSRFRSAQAICKFLESGDQSVFYDHTKASPPSKMTGDEETDRKNRDANIPRPHHGGEWWKPSPLGVGVGCCVYNIASIDAQAGTFYGHYRLMLKWHVPELSAMLKELDIPRDADRTPIPLSPDEWKSLTKVDVSQYKQFAKKIAVPSFALNTIDGDPVYTQKYAYVAESTDSPDIITMQYVFNSKFKLMEPSPMRYYPFDELELDFKIRLWDNKRDGARFFQPLRFPDGNHFLFPLKMNINLHDWNLFVPILRLYRQGGMKGENATGPSVYAMSLVAKRRPYMAFGKTIWANALLTSGLLLLSTLTPDFPVRDTAILALCGLKTIHCFRTVSRHLDTPIVDSYSVLSLGTGVWFASEALGFITKGGLGIQAALGSLALDLGLLGYTKYREFVESNSPNCYPQSNWNQEMGKDFDHNRVKFE